MSTKLSKNLYGAYAQNARTLDGTATRPTAEAILEDAKSKVHVITGATRDSGHIVESGLGYDVVFGEGAIYEEYGTVHRPPHPFLTPASERQRSGYLDKLREGLGL